MVDIRELLDQARALGKALAQHPHIRAFTAAQARARADAEARQLLESYRQHTEKVRALELQRKPIEPEDKRKLVEYEQKIASHPALKELMRAQADYVALMNQINRAIEAPLSADDAEEGPS